MSKFQGVITDASTVINKTTWDELRTWLAASTHTVPDGDPELVNTTGEQTLSGKTLKDCTLAACTLVANDGVTSININDAVVALTTPKEIPAITYHKITAEIDVSGKLTINNTSLAAAIPVIADDTPISPSNIASVFGYYSDGTEAGTVAALKIGVEVVEGVSYTTITAPAATTDATKVKIGLILAIEPSPASSE